MPGAREAIRARATGAARDTVRSRTRRVSNDSTIHAGVSPSYCVYDKAVCLRTGVISGHVRDEITVLWLFCIYALLFIGHPTRRVGTTRAPARHCDAADASHVDTRRT